MKKMKLKIINYLKIRMKNLQFEIVKIYMSLFHLSRGHFFCICFSFSWQLWPSSLLST